MSTIASAKYNITKSIKTGFSSDAFLYRMVTYLP